MSANVSTEHPAIGQIARLVTHLLGESVELLPGPASELVWELHEIPGREPGARALRVTANHGGQLVDMDVDMKFTLRKVRDHKYS